MQKIVWGTFGALHFITIGLVFIVLIILSICLKSMKEKTQRIILFIYSLLGPAAIIYNLLMWHKPLEYLPFHLCSLTAILIPVFLLTKAQWIGNMLPIFGIGALCAIILNMSMTEAKILSWPFFFYYFPHMAEFIIPFVLLNVGIIKMKPINLLYTLIFLIISYTLIHFINISINDYFISTGIDSKVNYMFSLGDFSNPLLSLMWKIIPYEYWYMYLLFPMITLMQYIFMIVFKKK